MSKHLPDRVENLSLENENLFDYMNAPIRVSDAVSMFRRPIKGNDRPYDQVVIKKNNELVEEWYEKVLQRLADKNASMPSGKVYPSWQIFFEGKEITRSRPFMSRLPVPQPDEIAFWITFLSQPIVKLYDAGSNTVAYGWQYLTYALRFHFANAKWEYIYSKSDDPYIWEREASSHPKLMKGEPLPYGLTKSELGVISEKVNCIMTKRVVPNIRKYNTFDDVVTSFIAPIHRNDRPDDAAVLKRNNDMVRLWSVDVVQHLPSLDEATVNRSWQIYYEGIDLRRAYEFGISNEFLRSTAFWKSLFGSDQSPNEHSEYWAAFFTRELDEIYDAGTSTVANGWQLLLSEIRAHFSALKWREIYQKSEDPWIWQKQAEACKELYVGEPLPFDLRKYEFEDLMVKVNTIMSIHVQPTN